MKVKFMYYETTRPDGEAKLVRMERLNMKRLEIKVKK